MMVSSTLPAGPFTPPTNTGSPAAGWGTPPAQCHSPSAALFPNDALNANLKRRIKRRQSTGTNEATKQTIAHAPVEELPRNTPMLPTQRPGKEARLYGIWNDELEPFEHALKMPVPNGPWLTLGALPAALDASMLDLVEPIFCDSKHYAIDSGLNLNFNFVSCKTSHRSQVDRERKTEEADCSITEESHDDIDKRRQAARELLEKPPARDEVFVEKRVFTQNGDGHVTFLRTLQMPTRLPFARPDNETCNLLTEPITWFNQWTVHPGPVFNYKTAVKDPNAVSSNVQEWQTGKTKQEVLDANKVYLTRFGLAMNWRRRLRSECWESKPGWKEDLFASYDEAQGYANIEKKLDAEMALCRDINRQALLRKFPNYDNEPRQLGNLEGMHYLVREGHKEAYYTSDLSLEGYYARAFFAANYRQHVRNPEPHQDYLKGKVLEYRDKFQKLNAEILKNSNRWDTATLNAKSKKLEFYQSMWVEYRFVLWNFLSMLDAYKAYKAKEESNKAAYDRYHHPVRTMAKAAAAPVEKLFKQITASGNEAISQTTAAMNTLTDKGRRRLAARVEEADETQELPREAAQLLEARPLPSRNLDRAQRKALPAPEQAGVAKLSETAVLPNLENLPKTSPSKLRKRKPQPQPMNPPLERNNSGSSSQDSGIGMKRETSAPSQRSNPSPRSLHPAHRDERMPAISPSKRSFEINRGNTAKPETRQPREPVSQQPLKSMRKVNHVPVEQEHLDQVLDTLQFGHRAREGSYEFGIKSDNLMREMRNLQTSSITSVSTKHDIEIEIERQHLHAQNKRLTVLENQANASIRQRRKNLETLSSTLPLAPLSFVSEGQRTLTPAQEIAVRKDVMRATQTQKSPVDINKPLPKLTLSQRITGPFKKFGYKLSQAVHLWR